MSAEYKSPEVRELEAMGLDPALYRTAAKLRTANWSAIDPGLRDMAVREAIHQLEILEAEAAYWYSRATCHD